MWIFKDPIGVMPHRHWTWADMAYPSEKWCVVPFKKLQEGNLTKCQNTYNHYVSKIHVRVEHAFAALKGQFQSLRELHIKIGNKPENMDLAMYWITCCFILHNMVVQFEERCCEELGQGTMDWAMREGEPDEGSDNDMPLALEPRSVGQQFHTHLMERLIVERGI
ncbi:hypothetical protein M404DRAFT_152038 [Pisolithus tinctorius Marx 270]|uniref:DDE Tnp4 domain-containing protein n=1 Tax=Pisolithus tinctorius Marx 270 TaxID=870435 RepID=A0A0C3NZV5_PISTI|nr:hypothetical protein M404DRAFT_152038 [Pisolithus tinctorius Marx 270]